MRNIIRPILLTLPLLAAAQAAPLRYAEDRAPAIVNPAFATTMPEARVNELVFEGLFSDDQELRSVPRLASTFTLADDKLSMVVQLAKDATWHDGTPFTSRDVVFTIEAMKNPTTASSEAVRVNWITRVRADGDHAVRLTFKEPEFAPEDKLHFKILPAHLFESTTIKRSDEFRNKPVGTGPFSVESFNDDNSVSLARFAEHPSAAKLEGMVMREVTDKNYQAKLIIYESLEALVRVLPRDIATLQNDRKIDLYPYQTNSWWYVGFNHQDPRFSNASVREAIHYLVDVDALLAPIGTGDILTGPFVRSSPYYNHQVPRRMKDGERARSLLAEAGYTFSGRYWVDADGNPLRIKLATQKNLETAQDVVINLQAQLLNEGIQVEPTFLGVAEWKETVWRDQSFDMILSQWSFDRNEDVYEQFHSKGSRNFIAYSSETVDDLLDRSRAAADPQEKKTLLREVHKAVAADAPMVFLWTLDSYAAMSTSVENVVVHPFYFFTWSNEWSLR